MKQRTWLITGVSSGFGHEMTRQLLEKGDKVIGTARRLQGGGRIIQLSSYGGQVAFPGNSMYHATKFGIEGFCEAVAPFLP